MIWKLLYSYEKRLSSISYLKYNVYINMFTGVVKEIPSKKITWR